MKLLLQRDFKGLRYTLGQLFIDQVKFCETLEGPVREAPGVPAAEWKVQGKTAIPAGAYRVSIVPSPHPLKMKIRLVDVPGFDEVLICGANTGGDAGGLIGGFIGVGQVRKAYGILLCSEVLARLLKRVERALHKGDDVFMEVR